MLRPNRCIVSHTMSLELALHVCTEVYATRLGRHSTLAVDYTDHYRSLSATWLRRQFSSQGMRWKCLVPTWLLQSLHHTYVHNSCGPIHWKFHHERHVEALKVLLVPGDLGCPRAASRAIRAYPSVEIPITMSEMFPVMFPVLPLGSNVLGALAGGVCAGL
jgi:hypothetical protein